MKHSTDGTVGTSLEFSSVLAIHTFIVKVLMLSTTVGGCDTYTAFFTCLDAIINECVQ